MGYCTSADFELVKNVGAVYGRETLAGLLSSCSVANWPNTDEGKPPNVTLGMYGTL